MQRILVIMKTLKAWQIGAIAAALLGTGGVSVYAMVSNGGGLGDGEQAVPVRKDTLVKQVSINGHLDFAEKAALVFSAAGTVTVVAVSPGQMVEEGQLLAALDPVTITGIEKAVAQARLALRKAEEAAAEARRHTPEDVTAAELAATQAAIAVPNAERALASAIRERDTKVAAAEEAYTEAVERYLGVYAKWLGISIDESRLNSAPADLLAEWDVDLEELFEGGLRFQDMTWGTDGLPLNDPETPWNERTIYHWLNLFPGSLMATCPGTLNPGDMCVTRDMNDAWQGYLEAGDALSATEVQQGQAVSTAQAALATARDTLVAAEKAHAAALDGPDPLNLAIAEADLILAQSSLDEALSRLDGVALRAPMPGVVAAVNVVVGHQASASNTAVEIINPGIINITGMIDEIDVLMVAEGDPALITMDALPGQPLSGTVTSIGSASASNQQQQGIVNYPISIRVEIPQGITLRAGLSATARVVVYEEPDAVLAPLQAIGGSFVQPTVRVMRGSRIEERPVAVGEDDGFWIVVREGLDEGEQVVMAAGGAPGGPGFPGGPGIPIRPMPAPGGGGGMRIQPAPGGGWTQTEEFRYEVVPDSPPAPPVRPGR